MSASWENGAWQEHGRFRSIDEVADVPGFGEKTLDKFRHRITL